VVSRLLKESLQKQTDEAFPDQSVAKQVDDTVPPEEVGLLKEAKEFALDATPVVGEIRAAKRIYDAVKSRNLVEAGVEALGLGLGLIPGVGDVAAKGVRGAYKAIKGADFENYVPKETRTAYKLFVKGDDEKLYPLFVNATKEVPKDKWIEADFPSAAFEAKNGKMYVPSKGGKRSKGEKTKGTGVAINIPDEATRKKLIDEGYITEKAGKTKDAPHGKVTAVAARPGWHASQAPVATHIGPQDIKITTKERLELLKAGITPEAIKRRGKQYYVKRRAEDHVYAEVQMANDVNYQTALLNSNKTDINNFVPRGGSYKYVDGQADSDKWVVGGDIKVTKVLSREESRALQKKLGVKDLPYRSEVEAILGKKFNKGGLAGGKTMYEGLDDYQLNSMGEDMAENAAEKQMEMAFMNEGGVLADDGVERDPVSGNEVPSGSMAEEVRDDVPAMLSEGEYVVPADVVRFHGIQKFEDLRDEAKIGLQRMEADGRIGGQPVEEQDELPFALEELEVTEAYRGGIMGFADGGDTGTYETAFGQPFTPNQRYGSMGVGGLGFQLRNFTNPTTGKTISVPFFNGKPMQYIPPEFTASDVAGSGGGTGSGVSDDRDRQESEAERARASGQTGTAFDLPSAFDDMQAPPKTFAEFKPEDWQRYISQADSTLADITAKVPVVGFLQRMSESAARSYADKALRSGVNPATGDSLSSQEILALQQVLTVAKNTGLIESVSNYFTGKKGETTGVPLYDQAGFEKGLLPDVSSFKEGVESTPLEGEFYKAGETDAPVDEKTLPSSEMEEVEESVAEKAARILDETKPKEEVLSYETVTPENYTRLVEQDKDGFFSMKADAAESPFFTPVDKPTFEITKEDKDLWVKTILGESSGEDFAGQLAVANVIKNRMEDGRFFRTWSPEKNSMGEWNGQTIKGVVTATSSKGYGQFSTWNDSGKGGNNPNRFKPTSKAYKQAAKIVDGIMYGDPKYVDNTNNAVYYLNKNAVPQDSLNNADYWYNKEVAKHGELKIGKHTFTGLKVGAGAVQEVKDPLRRPSDLDFLAPEVAQEQASNLAPKITEEQKIDTDNIYAPVLGDPSLKTDVPVVQDQIMSNEEFRKREAVIAGLSVPEVESPKDFTGQTTPPTRVTLPKYTPPTTDAFAEKTKVKREDIPALAPEQPSVSVAEPTIGQPKAKSGKLPQTDMPRGFLDYEPPTTGKRKVTDAKAFLAEREAAKKTKTKTEPKEEKKEAPKQEERKVPGVSMDKAREESQKVFMETGDAFAADRAYHEAFTGFTASGELSPSFGFDRKDEDRGMFKEGGLASRPKKTKPKKRNIKNGLGGKMAT